MSEEIDRLRAFAAEYQKITGEPAEPILRKIARLESESADPWRKAKSAVEYFRGFAEHKVAEHDVVAYVDHLTAENARLQKRVAELEREDTADVADAEAALAKGEFVPFEDMQPPYEGPIVGIEPVLDPSRVLATAAEIFDQKGQFSMRMAIAFYCQGAKPYRLKGAGDE